MSRRMPERRRFVRPQWAISIALALAAIGFVGAAMWNSSLAREQFVTSAQKVLVAQAEEQQAQQEQLRASIEEAESRVREFQAAGAQATTAGEQLNEQLIAARLATGLETVTGPGVVIEIADSLQPIPQGARVADYFVLVDDLRDIVTALWDSGAEAITIAGGVGAGVPAERLVSTSSIYGLGSSILVNTSPLSPPFRIEAIGPDGLRDRFLSNPHFLVRVAQRIDTFGLEFASEARDDLTLPAFIGNTRMKWGAAVGEAD